VKEDSTFIGTNFRFGPPVSIESSRAGLFFYHQTKKINRMKMTDRPSDSGRMRTESLCHLGCVIPETINLCRKKFKSGVEKGFIPGERGEIIGYSGLPLRWTTSSGESQERQ
jgi:hypothetical protein